MLGNPNEGSLSSNFLTLLHLFSLDQILLLSLLVLISIFVLFQSVELLVVFRTTISCVSVVLPKQVLL